MPLAALTPPPSRSALVQRPNTLRPRPSEESPLDKNALIDFVLKVTAALREQFSHLFKEPRSDPYYLVIGTLLSDVEKRLGRSTSPSESRLVRLLTVFERLSNWPVRFEEPTSPCFQSSFPQLVQLSSGRPERSRINIKSLVRDRSSKKAFDGRKKFEETFKNFAAVKATQRGPDLSELTKSSKASIVNNDATEYPRKVYFTLCQFCRCHLTADETSFTTNISLSVGEMSKDELMVHLFLLHQHSTNAVDMEKWKEACIKVYPERPENPDPSQKKKSTHFEEQGEEITDMCSLVRSKELGRLKLSASSRQLFNHGIELPEPGTSIFLGAPSVPLAQVLDMAGLKGDVMRKVLLSYLLAKAVWQFYDSDWMTEHWTKHTIHFMRQDLRDLQQRKTTSLDHRPFISTELRPTAQPQKIQTANKPTNQSHIYPRILALGVMLMEIELGEKIEKRYPEDFADGNGRYRQNASHMSAGHYINSDEWKNRLNTFAAIRHAIEICVKPDTGKLGTNPMTVRENLYTNVVAPLRVLFRTMYECPEPEKFDPGPITINGHFVPFGSSNDAPPKNSMVQIEDATSTCATLRASEVIPEASLLASLTTDIHNSSSWLEKFDHAKRHLQLKTSNENTGSNAARIAVLDTGCDVENEFFSGPGEQHSDDLAERWHDFVGGSAEPVDDDPQQHGTALAALLLRLVPGARIYVLRIARDKDHLSSAKETIAKAIIEAVKRWNVDIISMSFGFSEEVPSIRDAITEAEKLKSGKILFFAAANNDGLNASEMFPAFFESVISVRGTQHDGGFIQKYDPNTWAHKAGPHYGTLALDVHCGWVANKLTKSGCSVATPILASTAAVIISYVGSRFDAQNRFQTLIRTRRGILSVFQAMTEGQTTQFGKRYLTPWQLFENKRNPYHLIGDALSKLP